MPGGFASALTRLWELAGCPPLDTVKGTSRSSLSDWKNAKVVPDKAGPLESVVVDLRRRALDRGRAGRLSPQEHVELAELGVEHLEAMRGEARRLSAPGPGREELERLRRLSEEAVEDAGLLMRPNGRFPRGITLADLHVTRRAEQAVLDRAQETCAQLIVGEPGFGKTTVLWSLYRRLAEQAGTEPFFVKASSLLDSLKPAPDRPPTALGVPDVASALAHCTTHATPVLLVDTLDLLMHSADGAALVARLIDAARRQGVSVVMTCRPGEARLLPFDDADETESTARDAFLRPPVRLGAYSVSERAEAVTRHSRVYCSDALYGPSAADRLTADIMGAVYQDLPLREVCDNPLTLRMLFDVYAPDPPVQDIDIASLYDQVRRQRVEQDSRAGQGSAPLSSAASRDLRPIARALARYMLAANELEVDLPLVGHHLEELLPGVPWERIVADLDELERRGVISTLTGTTRVRFFHQTFFEYMAADWLRAAGRGPELVARMLANPTDLVLAAVAGQLVPREAPGAADRLLLPLLDDDRTVALGLDLYARLRGLGSTAEPARERLRSLPAEPVKRFLVVLPGFRHPRAERWIEDLTVVWERGEQSDDDGRAVRIQLLEAVCRLLRRHPAAAVGLLDDLDCMTWLLAWQTQELRSHDHLYLRLLRASFPHDPAWALDQAERFWHKFGAARVTQSLADLVGMVSEETHRGQGRSWASRVRRRALDRFVRLLDTAAPDLLGAELTALEEALGALWGAVMEEEPTAPLHELLRQAVKDDLSTPTGLARLYGAGVLAARLHQSGAEQFTDTLLALEHPRDQSAALDMVIVPTLVRSGRSRTDGARETYPFAEAVHDRCREALLQLPASAYQGSRRTLSTLFREAVGRARPDAAVLLGLLPDDVPQDLWLDSAGLAKLVVPAAAAGHPGARLALHAWATDPEVHAACTADPQTRGALATDFAGYVGSRPDLLAYPVDEAMLSGDTDLLVVVLDQAGSATHGLVRSYEEPLRNLVQRLSSAGGQDRRRQGHRLCRALVENAGWQPPAGATLADELRDAGHPLATSLLELVRAAAVTGRWGPVDAQAVIPALRKVVAGQGGGEGRYAFPTTARHVLTKVVCRLAPVEEPGRAEQVTGELLELIMPATQQEGRLVTEDIRELGRLIERVAPLRPETAASLLMTISKALHAYDARPSKPKREIANRWSVPLRVLLAHLGSGKRKALMLELVEQDVALARRAIEVFAQQQETSPSDPPTWFRELAHRSDLSPVLRQAVANRLRIHARTRCGGPWPELLSRGARTDPQVSV
ncbi:hypothetical protein ACFV0T_40125 [Streptomyces sp. NPDC059582]|uniref:hypothetical protein n=1 Tax=Streptomyces sp. NPDC059582 TaxID=3346875 RepID=UPI0036B2BD89